MSKPFNVVAVSGSTSSPSRTLSIIQEFTQRLGKQTKINLHLIELSKIGRELGASFTPNELPDYIQRDINAIEKADLLIVATPVYKASFTGLFKHLFDFVHFDALIDVPVVLAATGGSERHSLVIDHQLRPLFAFFKAHSLPIGLYATESDFVNYKLVNKDLDTRIDLAVEKIIPSLRHRDFESIEHFAQLAAV